MNSSQSADAPDPRLTDRLSPAHLRLRLGIECDRENRIFGQGLNFFHIENWYSVHGLIRWALRLTLLHGRGRRNARRIQVRRHHIRLPDLPPAFEGYTLLHLSDLHLDMSDDFPHVLADVVRGLSYNLCIMTGDYRARTFGATDATVAAMRRLRPHLGPEVLAVLGNHDSVRLVAPFEDMGIRVLLNEAHAIVREGARLHFAGVDDPHYYRADNLEKACSTIAAEDTAILLSHSPELYRQAAHAGFDAMLSGHTHGGQICLPGGIPLMVNATCPRAYCAGPWRYGGMVGYTSVGAGSSVVDVRLNCPPEVTLHRLTRRTNQ